MWPAVDLHLEGAGPGLSIIDGNQTGSCVAILQGASPASILEGFTLTNGSGHPTWINVSMLPTGGAGGVLRTVTAPVGASAVLEMLQPPHLASPCHFSIFGILGEANFDTVITVPLGIGDMMFAPAPLLPFYQPILFTLASSVGPINGAAALFPASPTPWNSGAGPAIPFPLTLTLQGVIEEAPGVFVPTNALVYVVE